MQDPNQVKYCQKKAVSQWPQRSSRRGNTRPITWGRLRNNKKLNIKVVLFKDAVCKALIFIYGKGWSERCWMRRGNSYFRHQFSPTWPLQYKPPLLSLGSPVSLYLYCRLFEWLLTQCFKSVFGCCFALCDHSSWLIQKWNQPSPVRNESWTQRRRAGKTMVVGYCTLWFASLWRRIHTAAG